MAGSGYGGFTGSQQPSMIGARRSGGQGQVGLASGGGLPAPGLGQGQGLPQLGGASASAMPTLGGPAIGSAAPGATVTSGYAGLSRRTAPQRGQLTAEDFPALGGGAPAPAPQPASLPSGARSSGTSADPGLVSAYPGSTFARGSSAVGRSLPADGPVGDPSPGSAARGAGHGIATARSQAPAASTEIAAENPGVVDEVAPGGPMAGVSRAARGGGVGRSSFGLLGLLDVIRMQDEDLVTLALGAELTSLGMDLQATRLASSIGLPWADVPTSNHLPYVLPSCYLEPTPSLPRPAFDSMSDEVLLYSFYALPGDVLQSHAAAQLYKRGWFYSGEQQLWFTARPKSATRDGEAPPVPVRPGPSAPWFFFNVKVWQRAECPPDGMDRIIATFVPESEIAESARLAEQHANRADAEAAQIVAAASAAVDASVAGSEDGGGGGAAGGGGGGHRRRVSSSNGSAGAAPPADLAASLGGAQPARKGSGSVWKGKAARGGR